MKRSFIFMAALCLLSFSLTYSQSETREKKIKKGWNLGAVPAIAYDSDIGFKYGAVVNFFNYGDGSRYPKYNHNIYLEWSRTTKGSGINQVTYDSDRLIPGVRILAEASYFIEKALDFYGFNGYNAWYNHEFEDSSSPEYLSRVFYRMDRSQLRLKSDFTGKLAGENLKWFGGIEYSNIKADTVDIQNLNKGKEESDKLPSTGGGLYGHFVSWGLIPSDQAKGGDANLLKAGVIYDTRDNEANPMKGLWTELQLLAAPGFIGNDFTYSRMVFTHRQYFTLAPEVLNFAYRLSYQAKLSGEMPFYMLPFMYNTPPQLTRDGLGGAKSMRGVLRNRVVGQDFFFGNAELRWKFLQTVILNQNFSITLAGFADGGMVTGKYQIPETTNTDALAWLAKGEKERLHLSYGAGLHFALNDNFIVTLDYGMASRKSDGNSGLYINFGFLY
jgi:outer membrane protein assembly factor BamA